jgi:hypothetical protein
VIKQIDRLEAQNQGRVAVLLEDDGGRERGFEAVRGAGAHHAAERPQSLATCFLVVRQVVQPALHRGGCAQARDDTPLGGRERQARRLGRVSSRERVSL